MLQEWRSVARSIGWRRSCGTADAPRLRTDVAGAFVDRTPIDWSALLTRTRDPGDHAAVEELRALDWLRGASRFAAPRAAITGRRFLFLRMLIAIAVCQTAVGFATAAFALASGESLQGMGPRVLLALAFAVASLLLGAALPRDGRSIFLLATYVFVAGAFARGVALALPAFWPAPLAVLFRGMFPEAFAPATLWWFAVVFPDVRRFTAFDVVARRIAAAVWVLGLMLFAVNLAAAYGGLGDTTTALGRNDQGNLFWHLFALAALPAVVTIVVRSHRASPAERRRVVRFACAVGIGAAPFLLTALARMTVPQVNQWISTAAPNERLWLDVLVVGALAAMPILTTVAMVLDRPFELPPIFSRPLLRLLDVGKHAVARTWRRRSVARMDYRGRLTEALEQVRLSRGSREIAVVLERELQLGTGATSVRILDRASLPSETALVSMLEESTTLDLSLENPLFGLMPRRDREWLEENGVALVAPLKLRDGTVAAIAAMGMKDGHASFDSYDRWFISTMLTAAAAAWDSMTAAADGNDEVALECPGCGLVTGAEPSPCGCGRPSRLAALPRHVGEKLIVLRRLGAGGMGVVYHGRDRALGRDVALKTLPALRDGAVSRLNDEARAMAALNHEALATIYGLEVWRRTPVLVVEYFPDGTLGQRLARGPLSAVETIDVGIRLTGGLTYMHGRGVLHRDIKPSNIGWTARGAPKLLDFGLATCCDPFAGTPDYLPPEGLGGESNVAVDLWGLSTVLLQACGGRERIPAELAAFFATALAKPRESRFQTADEMRSALQAIIAHTR